MLVFYFGLAVVIVVLSVYAAFLGIAVYASKGTKHPLEFFAWHPQFFFGVTIVVTGLIGLGSLYKIWSLGSDGENVALSLGGVKIPANSHNLDERILLNVVEEMALASGTPVPPVYLMENETGINAFAAGTTPQNAVIGITRGAIDTLKREELQGVIAHEFSHILNGDMRLNLRLMGLLNGILVIALIGYGIMRILGEVGFRSSRNSDSDGDGDKESLGIVAILVLIGCSLVAIGYIGVFFANLIKAAVSRQREFLADASAVQFTRNPNGIGDALKRIGGWAQHSKLKAAHAAEASHMFFGEGVVSYLFATHPALPDRIRRIDPKFDGTFQETGYITHSESELIDPRSLSLARSSFAGSSTAASSTATSSTAVSSLSSVQETASVHQAAVAGADQHEQQPQQAVSHIGEPRPEHISHAHHLVEELDPILADDVRDPLGAVAIIYAMLLGPSEESVRTQQLEFLSGASDALVLAELKRVSVRVDALAIEQRLPTACLALPALSQLSPSQANTFRNNVRKLIEADRRWTMFEFAIQRFITKRLVRRITDNRLSDSSAPTSLVESVRIVLSSLAHLGSVPSMVESAFAVGIREIPSIGRGMKILPRNECTLKSLDRALDVLEQSRNSQKRRMLSAFSACIAADGKVDVSELELLRVISDALGCPMPPVIESSHV
jgi:Zn-dependent protease with chaperone function